MQTEQATETSANERCPSCHSEYFECIDPYIKEIHDKEVTGIFCDCSYQQAREDI